MIRKDSNLSLILFGCSILFFFGESQSQVNCPNPAGIPPYTEFNKCLDGPASSANVSYANSNFDHTWEERINNYSNPGFVNWKQKYRSLFVNQSINLVGGFAVPKSSPSIHFDPNAVGSTLGVDGDNDGVYERENQLLQKIVDSHFDEIILYNVSNVLEFGDDIADDYSKNPGEDYDNFMLDNKPMDWHLARFIYKAKNSYGLKVIASVAYNKNDVLDKYSDFYDYFNSYGRSEGLPYDSQKVADVAQYYIDKYQDIWENNPEELKYLDYGEDTLLLPRDGAGRISILDKALVDVANLNLFEYKVKTGIMNNLPGSAESEIGTGENKCDNAFDGHLFEWEWWDKSDPDNALTAMLQLIQISKSFQQETDICYPEHYVVQDEFDDPGWNGTFRTEQERADAVDKKADRIYLYTYHKNPCDCYWGRGNYVHPDPPSLDKQDFKYQVELLKNNTYGEDEFYSGSIILPVFNGKFDCPDLVNSTDIPQSYGDGNHGCNGAPGCDYDVKYSGVALNDLAANGLPKQFEYVENIFQEQYDFDVYNTSQQYSSNVIYGYCWFKSRILSDNGVVSSKEDVKKDKSSVNVYPNPSNDIFNIKCSASRIDNIEVYSTKGRLIKSEEVNAKEHSLRLQNVGVYFLKIQSVDGSVITKKVVRW